MSLCIIPEKKKCNIPVFSFIIFFPLNNVSISLKLFFYSVKVEVCPGYGSKRYFCFFFSSSIFEIEKDTRKSYR